MLVQREIDDWFDGGYVLVKPKEELTDVYALRALKRLSRDLSDLVEIERTLGEYSLIARVPTRDPEVLRRFQEVITRPGFGRLIEEVVILPIRTSMYERKPIEKVGTTQPLNVVELYRVLVQDFYDQRGWGIYFDAIPFWGDAQNYPPPMGGGKYNSITPMEDISVECEVEWIPGSDSDQTFGYAPRGYVEITPTETPDEVIRVTHRDGLSVLEDIGINPRDMRRIYKPLE